MVEPGFGFGKRMGTEARVSSGRGPRAILIVAFLAAPLLIPSDVVAQIGGDGFLFRAPNVSLSVRGGYATARGGSEMFDELSEFLIMDRRSFSGFTLGADVGVRATDRLEVVFGATYDRSSGIRSEDSVFVELIDGVELPIEQKSRLERVPLTASVRFYPLARGRTIGQFAWVPSKWAPYVGLGGGAMYHNFTMDGDFVDYLDESIYPDRHEASGWSPVGQVLGGFELGLGRRSAIALEARYMWSSADLSFDFDQLPIDLAGFQMTAGISFRL